MERLLYLAKENPNFTDKDRNRPLFFNKVFHDKKVAEIPSWDKEDTILTLRTAWILKVFGTEGIELKNFNRPTRLTGSVNVSCTAENVEERLNVSYVMIDENGKQFFYFVTTSTVSNNNVVTYQLKMDTITTYMYKLNYGKSAKIERRHFDRWTIEGENIVANNEETSGIWNDENEVQNATFIKKNVIPVNVLSEEVRAFILGDGKNTFWPVAIMNMKDYYHGGGLGNSPISRNNDILTYSSLFTLSPSDRLLTIDGNTDKKILSMGNVNWETLSPFVIKIFSLPLPYFNNLYVKDNKLVVNGTNMPYNSIIGKYVSSNDETYYTSYQVAYDTTYKFGPLIGSGVTKRDKYSFKYDLSEIIKNRILLSSVSEDFDILHEIKLETTKHKQIKIKSVNGQNTHLVNEFLFKDNELKLEISQAISFDGSYQYIEVKENSFYDKYNSDKSKTFTISYKDQLPNSSNKYADFIATQGNSYKTAIANNRLQMGLGIVGSLLGGGVSAIKGNSLGAGMGMFGITNNIAGGITRERTLDAQVKDLQNLGQTTELEDYSIIKDSDYATVYGDSKLAITVEEHPQIQKEAIASYYNRYGYSANRLEKIEDYSYFDKRSLFTYMQSPLISSGIDKKNISNEVMDDIDNLFADGIRLWNIQDEQGNLNINNYEKENWEHEVKKAITH